MGVLAIILPLGAIVGSMIYIVMQQQKKRTLAIQSPGGKLGWRFEPRPPFAVVPGLERPSSLAGDAGPTPERVNPPLGMPEAPSLRR